MSRKKRGNPVHGWLVLDKPSGMTSTAAVGAIKRLYNAQKAGHAGTLDPLATGILPIALGEATKTVPYIVDGAKSYRFTVRWGIETDTDDSEGQVTASGGRVPSADEIVEVLPRFMGEILQRPPRYSAVKIDGERAYDLAREGATVEIAERPVVIDRLEIVGTTGDETVLEADCGKGTYVRALARDLGRTLGTYGHVTKLRRLEVGPFDEQDAVTLAEVTEAAGRPDAARELRTLLKPLESALTDLIGLSVSREDALRLRRGNNVLLRGRDAPIFEGLAYATSMGDPVALVSAEHGYLVPKRVFMLG
ncbi:MAG: tRNA pseudouridine(55) synthase TruB [Hyphomicrobiaceae bacterium]